MAVFRAYLFVREAPSACDTARRIPMILPMTPLAEGTFTSTLPLTRSEPLVGPRAVSAGANVRVLHIINGEHYSGAERVQDLLAACLPQEGFDVGFACLKPHLFPRLRRWQSSPVYLVPMRSRFDLRVVGQLRRLVLRGGYRILHAHTPRSVMPGRLAAWWSGVSFVYHVHSPALRDTAQARRNWINGLAERWSLRGDCRLIAVSSSLGEEMVRQGVRPGRIAVVPNGVPAPSARRSVEPPGPTWTLGVIGLFRPRKGLEVLLDALSLLRADNLSWRLRAVGAFEASDYEAQIRARAKQLDLEGTIQWAGFRSDVAAELAGMDLLVLPSLFGEGMPMVVLEAMAAGVPVVATRVEGIPEAIEDGVQGLLARSGDAGDLARCLASILRGEPPWLRLRHNALARHAERFSDRRMAAGVARVYREVLAGDEVSRGGQSPVSGCLRSRA